MSKCAGVQKRVFKAVEHFSEHTLKKAFTFHLRHKKKAPVHIESWVQPYKIPHFRTFFYDFWSWLAFEAISESI